MKAFFTLLLVLAGLSSVAQNSAKPADSPAQQVLPRTTHETVSKDKSIVRQKAIISDN